MLHGHITNIVTLFLLCFFVYTCYFSWSKYAEKRISSTTMEKQSYVVPYPSITVCPSGAAREKFEEQIFKPNISARNIEYVYKEAVWRKNETFYFVNQKNYRNQGFPCMTSPQDTYDPGKPCRFPFNLPQENL